MSLQTNHHIPVLLDQVLDMLAPKPGESYLDLTAGYGGHASSVLDLTKSEATLVDRDQNAIAALSDKFGDNPQISIVNMDFLQACRQLQLDGKKFDLILADLGVSSPHLDKADRGFSILVDGPLDMRMDETQDLTAEQVVNTYPQQDLERILRAYGEEPKARRMAQLIIESRPLKTTHQLAEIGKRTWPGHSRVHPATRLFQAIRIEVNNELGQLELAMPVLASLLSDGGRLAIISFHSLEDRIVKRFFRDNAGERYDTDLTDLTRKPLTAARDEVVINPRSRSAKVRAVAKIKIKKERQD